MNTTNEQMLVVTTVVRSDSTLIRSGMLHVRVASVASVSAMIEAYPIVKTKMSRN